MRSLRSKDGVSWNVLWHFDISDAWTNVPSGDSLNVHLFESQMLSCLPAFEREDKAESLVGLNMCILLILIKESLQMLHHETKDTVLYATHLVTSAESVEVYLQRQDGVGFILVTIASQGNT